VFRHPAILRLQGDFLMNDDSHANPLSGSPSGAVAAAARNIGNGAVQATRDVASTAAQEASQVSRAAREWWLQHKYDTLHAVEGVRDRSQEYVRAQPIKSVLVAAGFGALIATVWILAARRSHS
jgi:ElaB/YqjD/DUF883 family membrane-anchored ribosome-binding protein